MAVVGDAPVTQRDLGKLRAHLGVEPVPVHPEVAGRVTLAHEAGKNAHAALQACGIISGMPAMTATYLFQTPAGLLKIRQFNGGQWRLWAEDEFLGSFVSPEAAVQALLDGTCSLVAGGRKASVDVPPDLSDWMFDSAR